mgnify:CR=1 FL=1
MAIISSVIGLVASIIVMAKPRATAILMIIAAIVGFISVSALLIFGTILLLIAVILAFWGRNEKSPTYP